MGTETNILFSSCEDCNSCKSKNLSTNGLTIMCENCGEEYPKFNKDKSIENSENLVFGYGSLILPTSFVSRFTDYRIKTSQIYSKDPNKINITAEGILKWSNTKHRIIPCKLTGFKRYYSYDSKRGGKMLECERTDNKEDFVNGFILTNITDEEFKKMSSIEEGYHKEELKKDKFTFYAKEPNGNPSINIYLSENINNRNYEKRNRIYHNRIMGGIRFLELKYDDKVRREFLKDFEDSFK